MVICSNATSFMKEKEKAMREFARIIKPWGFIATCPMYYEKDAPKELVKEVSKIIGAPIDIRKKEDWISLFNQTDFEIYSIEDYSFNHQSSKVIDKFVQETLNKPHLLSLPKLVQEKIAIRWKNILSTFNDNLSYLGYSVILLRKRNEIEEAELFSTISN